jgi:hypothetical protein
VCAGGGFALTTGVQWAADRLSEVATPPWLNKTKDPGIERLAEQTSSTEGPLTVTVLSVRVNDEVTMVKITATNTGSDSLTLPESGFVQLTTSDTTLQSDFAAGNWAETVPGGGGKTTGTIVFDGRPPAGSDQVTLTFTQIFGSLGGPDSIAVTIPLTSGP